MQAEGFEPGSDFSGAWGKFKIRRSLSQPALRFECQPGLPSRPSWEPLPQRGFGPTMSERLGRPLKQFLWHFGSPRQDPNNSAHGRYPSGLAHRV